ncbi:MAG: biotin--[acetyl-CoA-carboxylase] ligase [Halobacteriales archaeon]
MDALDAQVLAAVAAAPAPVAVVAERLRADGAAVEEAVRSLRERGRLRGDAPAVELADGLAYRGAVIEELVPPAYRVELRQTVDSTNRLAADRLEAGAERILVVAEAQTAGRGRQGRSWRSPRGGIWASFGDAHPHRASTGWVEGLALAMAVVDVVDGLGLDARLKWPNDVTLDGGKLAGVLVSATTVGATRTRTVAGVGLNANVEPADLPTGSTSLQSHVGPVVRAPILAAIAWAFEGYRRDREETLAAWRGRCDTVGRDVVVETTDGRVRGVATGLTADGALEVDTDGETLAIRPERCRRLRHGGPP